jgi:hypothetical protein
VVGVLSGFTRWYHRSEKKVCEHQPCQRNMSMQPYVALVNVVVVVVGCGVDLCCSTVVAIMPWSKLWEKVKYTQYASDKIFSG